MTNQPAGRPAWSIGAEVSATIEETKPIVSKLDNFAGISLADISTIGASAIDDAILRVIPESQIKPVPVASFGSAI
jgi:hypothetical protein